jgi:hypothetical protein
LGLRGEEGRVKLRKVSGSCQKSFDPIMSEWENLIRLRIVINANLLN